ncbi:hypothetical protein QCA50_014479 [Cerrena zonata]|uniref:Alpha/beta hydrolase fold-3 domain-containing protein n=1 Tax=Cerrena zonata TaxID=2478898 RepID=A0AAW0FY38_9APHY
MLPSSLDPEIAAILAQLPSPPKGSMTIEERRAGFAMAVAGMQKGMESLLPNESEYTVEDHAVSVEGGEIRVRSVVPKGGEDLPLLVWFHGGGWALGDLDMDDYYLKILSVNVNISILNVEYRLTPEFTFPTNLNDAYAGLKWAAENAKKLSASLSKGFMVGGASAGGNFAAVVSLLARDDLFFKDRPLTGQLLIVPITVHVDANVDQYRSELLSMEENKDAPFLDADTVRYFEEILQVSPEDPRISVLLAKSHANLPPAYVQVSGLDPLRDEGILYEKVLRNAGVKTQIHVYPELPHGGHAFFPTTKNSIKFNADTEDGIRWLLSL